MFEALEAFGCGFIAPAMASLLELYESCAERRMMVGSRGRLSDDERSLLAMIDGEGARPVAEAAASAGLAAALGAAADSVRSLVRPRLERARTAKPAPATGRRRRQPISNYPKALADRLGHAYRVTAQILGKTRFQALAQAFARRHPPADPAAGFDARFPDFLAEQVDGLPYLADVAQLDRLWTEAAAAPDAPALALPDLDAAAWASRRLPLHPATRFVWLSTPAVTLWQAHLAGHDPEPPEPRAEGALVTRPADQVALRTISRPEHRLLFGLRLGETFGEAGKATAALYPETDVDTVFAGLVDSGAFARPHAPEPVAAPAATARN